MGFLPIPFHTAEYDAAVSFDEKAYMSFINHTVSFGKITSSFNEEIFAWFC
jgi:hypothetical protein